DQTVTAGARISSAEVRFAYKSATAGDTTYWYFEVYNGATLIGTHGSTGTPVSCNGATSYVTDKVSLPEVDTVAEANNLVIKIFMKSALAKKSLHDVGQLTIDY